MATPITIGAASSSAANASGSLVDSTNFSPSLLIGSPNASLTGGRFTSTQEARTEGTATSSASGQGDANAAASKVAQALGEATPTNIIFWVVGAVVLFVVLKKKKVI